MAGKEISRRTFIKGIAAGAVTLGTVGVLDAVSKPKTGVKLPDDIDLERFKDAVREVSEGYECGVGLENYSDIKEGDVFECFVMEQITD